MLPMHVSTSTPAPGSSSSSSSSGTASSLNQGKLSGILSCVLYSFCSVAMVLANKAIPSTVPLELRSQMPQVGVLLFQCIIALGLVELARIFGYADYETVKWSVAKQWLPINLFFIAMLVTGFLSLVYASVPMVTIFKNLTNLVTVSGDWYLNNEDVSNLTVISILVMTAGAALAGLNDLEFSWIGYFWMIMNCLSTSGYVLYTKYATSNIKLSKLGMVYYNNLLSSVLLIPVCLYLGEWQKMTNPDILTPVYLFSNVMAGFLGVLLNFASLWCIGVTSATTYAIVGTIILLHIIYSNNFSSSNLIMSTYVTYVPSIFYLLTSLPGSLNKVPITVLGFVLFDAKMTSEGLWFVALATLGGMLYAYSKLPKNK